MAVCGVKVTKLTELIHISASHIQWHLTGFVCGVKTDWRNFSLFGAFIMRYRWYTVDLLYYFFTVSKMMLFSCKELKKLWEVVCNVGYKLEEAVRLPLVHHPILYNSFGRVWSLLDSIGRPSDRKRWRQPGSREVFLVVFRLCIILP